MARYFQVTSPSPQRLVVGEYIMASSVTAVYNGHLAGLSTEGGAPAWIKTNGTVPASGMFYEHMNLLEEMVDRLDLNDEQAIDLMAGKRVGVISGQFRALLNADYFNTAPSVGAKLYDAEDGTITTVASNHELIGYCLGTQVSGDTTLYDCWFDFGSVHGVG